MSEDELTEEMLRDLIEQDLDEQDCADAIEWLNKRVRAYDVLQQLKQDLGVADETGG